MEWLAIQKALADGMMLFFSGVQTLFVLFIIPITAFFLSRVFYYSSKKTKVTEESFLLINDLQFMLLSTSLATKEDRQFFIYANDSVAKGFSQTKMNKNGLMRCLAVKNRIQERIKEIESRSISNES